MVHRVLVLEPLWPGRRGKGKGALSRGKGKAKRVTHGACCVCDASDPHDRVKGTMRTETAP